MIETPSKKQNLKNKNYTYNIGKKKMMSIKNLHNVCSERDWLRVNANSMQHAFAGIAFIECGEGLYSP